jgi:hypothetical protein
MLNSSKDINNKLTVSNARSFNLSSLSIDSIDKSSVSSSDSTHCKTECSLRRLASSFEHYVTLV